MLIGSRRVSASLLLHALKRVVSPNTIGLVLALAIAGGCSDRNDALLSLLPQDRIRLSIAPQFAQLGAESAAPVNRIRITARKAGTNTIVGMLVTDVDPNAVSWDLNLEIQLQDNPTITVAVTMELLHVEGGMESIEWSGATTIAVVAARAQPVASVQVFRGPPSNLTITAVRIATPVPQMIEGTRALLSATAEGASGSPQIFWLSLDPAIATVDTAGALLGVRPGSARIVATAGPRADTVTVTVTQRIVSVELTPPTASLQSFGTLASFQARILDPRGAPIANAGIAWSVADAAIAENLGNGEFRARSNGETIITATALADPLIRATARLVVGQRVSSLDLDPRDRTLTSIGARQQFTAAARDANGSLVAAARSTWSSTSPGVVTIDANGLATATGAGSTTIRASTARNPGSPGDSTVATTTLTVSQAVARVEVLSGSSALFAIADTLRFTARAFDGNAFEIRGREFTWTSSNAGVATIDANGLVTATGAGSTTIRASTARTPGSPGDSTVATATLTVSQSVARVQVLPDRITLFAIADTLRLSVRAFDRNAFEIRGRTFNWTSSNSAAARVDGSGLVTAVAPGEAVIRAETGGITGNATVNVTQRIASVEITPPSASLPSLGDLALFQARVLDPRGAAIANAGVTWSIANAAIAENLGNGEFRARSNGETTVTAAALGDPLIRVTARLIVEQRVSSVDLSPRDRTLTAIGARQQFTAVARDAGGSLVGAARFTWSSTAPGVAAIDANGLATATGAGSTTIRASTPRAPGSAGDSTVATTTLTVSASVALVQVLPGSSTLFAIADTLRLSARAFDGSAVEIRGRTFGWTSSNPAVARVDDSGLVTAVAPGEAVIRAETGGVTGSANVTVRQTSTQVIVSPAFTTAELRQGVQYNATARDRNGNAVPGSAPVWSSSNPGVATIVASGLATVVGYGTTTITATIDGVAGNAELSAPRPARQVTVVPASATLNNPGDTLRLSATVRDASGALLAGQNITWTSFDTGVADVSSSGLVTARQPGSVDITATSGDASGTANITVLSHAPIATITVVPDRALLRTGETLGLTAIARDVNNNVVAGVSFTWSTSDPALASVSSTGFVNGIFPGDVAITATSEGRSATSQITVYAATATTLEKVSGDAQGGTVSTAVPNPLVVRVLDQFGRPLSGRVVRWVIASGGGSAIPDSSMTDVDGLARTQWVLGPSAGSQSIQARAGGTPSLQTMFTATANAAAVASIQVDPATRTMVAGTTFTFTATARDANSNVLPGVIVSWRSSDTLVARVNGTGQVAAGLVGTATISATANGKTGTAVVTVNRGPAAALAQYSGSGQSGRSLAPLPDSLRVLVIDVAGNPVSGFRVDWVVTAGGGSVSPSFSITDAAGLAATKWTLGALVGTQTVEARAMGLAGSPSQFVASASGPQGVRKTWIGGDASAPTNWSTPGNWSPAGIPSDLDTAFIAASAANQPTMSSYLTVGGLIIEVGASLNLSGYQLDVYGSVAADGAVTNVGNLTMYGTNVTVRGTVSNLFITGTVRASGPLTVNDLTVDCPVNLGNCVGNGEFALNGNTITVLGNFAASGGILTMTNPADQLIVSGSATFAFTNETGRLTSGRILVGGNFSLGCYNSTEFVSTGTRLVMNGSSAQSIALGCSASSGNRLYDLTIAAGATVTTADNPLFIANTLTVNGTFGTTAAAVVDVAGPANSVVINSGGVLNNSGQLKANLPIINNGVINGNAVTQR